MSKDRGPIDEVICCFLDIPSMAVIVDLFELFLFLLTSRFFLVVLSFFFSRLLVMSFRKSAALKFSENV
jgi:hypothetical protein